MDIYSVNDTKAFYFYPLRKKKWHKKIAKLIACVSCSVPKLWILFRMVDMDLYSLQMFRRYELNSNPLISFFINAQLSTRILGMTNGYMLFLFKFLNKWSLSKKTFYFHLKIVIDMKQLLLQNCDTVFYSKLQHSSCWKTK